MLLFWISLAFAEDACSTISLSDVVSVPESSIIVLGARRGAQPDVARAQRVIKALQAKTQHPVTLAIDFVHHSFQGQFDAFGQGHLDPLELETQLEWTQHSATTFKPYGRLFKTVVEHGMIYAVGSDLESPPPDVGTPIPGVYPDMVNSVIPEGQLVFGLDNRIAETMAYWDYQIANRALNEWDQQGYLVILTDRSRVEGGGGVPWQLVQRKTPPVYAFLLAWAEPYCTEGDNVWARNPLFHTLGFGD